MGFLNNLFRRETPNANWESREYPLDLFAQAVASIISEQSFKSTENPSIYSTISRDNIISTQLSMGISKYTPDGAVIETKNFRLAINVTDRGDGLDISSCGFVGQENDFAFIQKMASIEGNLKNAFKDNFKKKLTADLGFEIVKMQIKNGKLMITLDKSKPVVDMSAVSTLPGPEIATEEINQGKPGALSPGEVAELASLQDEIAGLERRETALANDIDVTEKRIAELREKILAAKTVVKAEEPKTEESDPDTQENSGFDVEEKGRVRGSDPCFQKWGVEVGKRALNFSAMADDRINSLDELMNIPDGEILCTVLNREIGELIEFTADAVKNDKSKESYIARGNIFKTDKNSDWYQDPTTERDIKGAFRSKKLFTAVQNGSMDLDRAMIILGTAGIEIHMLEDLEKGNTIHIKQKK